jgi:hypothetical protein
LEFAVPAADSMALRVMELFKEVPSLESERRTGSLHILIKARGKLYQIANGTKDNCI